jgi:DNA-binding MarR family transcriptional regulator
VINIEQSPVHIIHRAAQHASMLFRSATGEDEIMTLRRVTILAALTASDGQTSQVDICERTGIDRSTLASVMRELERLKLIKRTRTKHDRRAYNVTLTALGTEHLARLAPVVARIDAELVATLKPATLTQLRRLRPPPGSSVSA